MSDENGEPASTAESDPDPTVIIGLLSTLTPDFIRKRYALKFGIVLLVMALSIGAIGVAATEVITAETEENVEVEYQGIAGQQADIIEQWLQSNSLQTQLLSANQVWTGDDPDDLEFQLETQSGALASDVAEMHLVDDVQGTPTIAASTDLEPGDSLSNAADRDWFGSLEAWDPVQDLTVGEVFVSDTYAVGGDRVVGFVSPTAVEDDRYLFVEVSVFDIQQSLTGADSDQDIGFTQVVNTDSYLVDQDQENVVVIDARGEEGKLLQEYATDEATLEPLVEANELRGTGVRSGVISEMPADPDVLDEVYTVGYAPVEDNEWVVVTHGPRSDVFGFVDTLSTWGFIITLFSVLLIGVTGTVLGYSTSTSIDRLTRKTEEMREGTLNIQLHTTRIDNIGRLYDGFGDMRDALRNQIDESERARKEAEVARAEAEEMASYLQEKAEEYSDVMQQVSAGDLTQRMEQDGEEASMDRIAEEFNQMIEELEKTTGQLKSYVDEVEEAGTEVEQSSDTVRDASEQVADSIQTISDDAYDQKDRLQTISETMDEVADRLETYAASHEGVDIDDSLDQIQQVAGEINQIADLGEETMAEAEHVAGAAEEQAAELNEVSERANDLQRYAQPLRDILGRFETEAEHEFVFSVGPTGGSRDVGAEEEE